MHNAGGPAPAATPQADREQQLCTSAALEEKGLAVVFDVLQYGRPVRAFALRFEGKVVAYLNRCLHVPTELDWQPGVFLDSGQEFIMCSVHGAAYEPHGGRCIGGPCGRGRLTAIKVHEHEGRVYWYPSNDIRPAPGVPNADGADVDITRP